MQIALKVSWNTHTRLKTVTVLINKTKAVPAGVEDVTPFQNLHIRYISDVDTYQSDNFCYLHIW